MKILCLALLLVAQRSLARPAAAPPLCADQRLDAQHCGDLVIDFTDDLARICVSYLDEAHCATQGEIRRWLLSRSSGGKP